MKFDVFLSHNGIDKPAVENLAHKLEAKGLKVWLDKWNLIPGNSWEEEIEEALDHCQTFAVFLGPSGLGPWENEEMRSALEDRVQDRNRRVIPVLLPGAPDNKTLKLPRFLRRTTWVDFREGLDDEDALYRLECGIKGISPGKTSLSSSQSILLDRPIKEAHASSPIDNLPAIHSTPEFNEVLQTVMEEIVRLTKAERSFLMLRDERGEMRISITLNWEQESINRIESSISHTIIQRVVEDRVPVLTTNTREDPRFEGQESIIAFNLRSILCVPLVVNQVTIGVIYVDNRIRTGIFSEADRDLLMAFANQSAVTIENARLQARS